MSNKSQHSRFRSIKNVVAVTGITVAMLAISACGGNGEASAPAPVVSESATSSPSPTATATSTDDHNGIPVKGVAQNAYGKYLQTTLKEDDPIITSFEPKFVNGDAVDTFTEDELREAVKIAQVFVAEEGIDSILNGSNEPADLDAWWAANKEKFTANLQGKVYDYAKAKNTIVVRGAWDTDNVNNRQYWYDENSTRIQIRENAINYVEVSSKWPNSVGIDTKLDYIIWGKDEAGNKYPINVKGNYYLNLKKDETTGGKWLIDGQNSKYEGFISNK